MPLARLPPGSSPTRPTRRLRTRAWSAGRLLLLAVGLSVTFGAFFMTGMRVANKAREVEVPDVRGLSMAAATQALTDAGLGLRIEMRRADAKVPADHVLAQEPEPGTVLRRQRAIRVSVSEGQRAPEIPAVVGQVERTAEIVLTQEQVKVAGRAEIRTDAYPSDVVVAQDPPASSRASEVSLLVNRGENGVGYVMPDVIGAIGGRVVDILRRRGFRVTVGAEVPYPGLPSGVVIRQTPQAGFQVGYGDAIVLEVSK